MSESDVCRRHILTSKVGPRAESVKRNHAKKRGLSGVYIHLIVGIARQTDQSF